MGVVLLKNDRMLPLRKNSSIAVLGPMAVNTQLMSDYAGGWNGVAGCWPKGDESCIITIGQAIALANDLGSTGRTTITQGVDVSSNRTDGIAAAVAAADAAETVVLVLGNDRSTENENLDRPMIDLPGQQQELARQVLALGKPTVLILSNGGAVAIDGLIDGPKAIVEAFSPAQQTPALAALLFGDENRWGRLPYTICKHARRLPSRPAVLMPHLTRKCRRLSRSKQLRSPAADGKLRHEPSARQNVQVLLWSAAVRIWEWALTHYIQSRLQSTRRECGAWRLVVQLQGQQHRLTRRRRGSHGIPLRRFRHPIRSSQGGASRAYQVVGGL